MDCFLWPAACEALVKRASAELESVASLIAEQAANGIQAIAVCSIDDAEGCTTVALCLSRFLAERGTRVCLVDGNFRHPGLAESLSLETDCGLDSVLAGDVPLDEVLVESLEDQLTVLPLARPVSAEALQRTKLRQTVTFGELRHRFDAILIDAGSIGVSPAHRQSIVETGSVDAVILVGSENSGTVTWQRASRAVEQLNVQCLGAIENRCAM